MPLSPNAFYDSDLVAKRNSGLRVQYWQGGPADNRPWNQRMRFPEMDEGNTPLTAEIPGGRDSRMPHYTPDGMQAMRDATPEVMTDSGRAPSQDLGQFYAHNESPMKRGMSGDDINRLLDQMGMVWPDAAPELDWSAGVGSGKDYDEIYDK